MIRKWENRPRLDTRAYVRCGALLDVLHLEVTATWTVLRRSPFSAPVASTGVLRASVCLFRRENPVPLAGTGFGGYLAAEPVVAPSIYNTRNDIRAINRHGLRRGSQSAALGYMLGLSSPASANFDRSAAIALSRPWAACWYLIAACGVEWPRRAINSAKLAPVAAASTAPLCRRSCQRRSGRLAAARALYQCLPSVAGCRCPPCPAGNSSESRLTPTYFARWSSIAGMMCGGIATSRSPASDFGVVTE